MKTNTLLQFSSDHHQEDRTKLYLCATEYYKANGRSWYRLTVKVNEQVITMVPRNRTATMSLAEQTLEAMLS